ncbi:juvenile hormone esterase-like [Frankliniella occidentalis]|uniref:Juvenile hormone esterase-like n=1 Tax=Frankliniella occidentalis TaxID=133901 RepID=A0A9C6X057_FRAOC|nr:juvenile hormone esterase-like [Frankliniella occidentalis]
MIDDDMTCTIPDPLYRKLSPEKRVELAGKIRHLYFKGAHVTEETAGSVIDLFGDLQLTHGIHVTSKWFAHYSSANNPLYIYFFTFASKFGLSFFFSTKNLKGAGHGEELSYVFRHHLFKNHPTLKQTAREQAMRETMVGLLSNFIKSGNPTPHNATVAADTQKVNISWPAVHPGRMNYLEIGDELSVKKDFLKERMNFWDRVYRDTLGTPLYDFF